MSNPTKEVIEFDKYRDETNDPAEIRMCKLKGPLAPDGSGTRIPHSGFVYGDIEYELVGFGKIDKKPVISLPPEVDLWLRKELKAGYTFNVTPEMKSLVIQRLTVTRFVDLKKEYQAYRNEGAGPVQALKYVIDPKPMPTVASPKASTEDRPKKPKRMVIE